MARYPYFYSVVYQACYVSQLFPDGNPTAYAALLCNAKQISVSRLKRKLLINQRLNKLGFGGHIKAFLYALKALFNVGNILEKLFAELIFLVIGLM